MMSASENRATEFRPQVALGQHRIASLGEDPAVLADIYREDVNIAIWKRELSGEVSGAARSVLSAPHGLELSMTVSPDSVRNCIEEALPTRAARPLSEDISDLVAMFCCLFEIERVGLRLTALDRAMCPRFHVDNVPCRFLTTYQGPATEWLPHQAVDRSKLGRGSNGLPDRDSGLYGCTRDVCELGCGDVALLKGELWEGNENAGLVHRSPTVPDGVRRLILTLDMLGG